MAEEFTFEVVDARKPPEEIQEALRLKIEPLLKNGRAQLAPAGTGSPVKESATAPPAS